MVDLGPVLILAGPLAHGDDDVIGREPAGGVQDVRRDWVRMRHWRLQPEIDVINNNVTTKLFLLEYLASNRWVQMIIEPWHCSILTKQCAAVLECQQYQFSLI